MGKNVKKNPAKTQGACHTVAKGIKTVYTKAQWAAMTAAKKAKEAADRFTASILEK